MFSFRECTSDLSHQERMPLVRRYAVMNTEEVKVSQNFIAFITVKDRIGKRLPDYLLAAADKLGLRKGQAYDNEKNGPCQGCTSAHPPLQLQSHYHSVAAIA